MEHLRRLIDANYHSQVYSKEREDEQNSIVFSLLERQHGSFENQNEYISPPRECENWIVLTCGPMGAGKTSVVNWLLHGGHLPLTNPVCVDMDEIREMLPGSNAIKRKMPDKFGELTQREAGLVAELTILSALERRRDLIVDSSLKDVQWQKQYLAFLTSRYPHSRVALVHVTASEVTIRERVARRNHVTGRRLPLLVLEHSLKLRSLVATREIQELCHVVLSINNDCSAPKLVYSNQHDCSWEGVRLALARPRHAPSPLGTLTSRANHTCAPQGGLHDQRASLECKPVIGVWHRYDENDDTVRPSPAPPSVTSCAEAKISKVANGADCPPAMKEKRQSIPGDDMVSPCRPTPCEWAGEPSGSQGSTLLLWAAGKDQGAWEGKGLESTILSSPSLSEARVRRRSRDGLRYDRHKDRGSDGERQRDSSGGEAGGRGDAEAKGAGATPLGCEGRWPSPNVVTAVAAVVAASHCAPAPLPVSLPVAVDDDPPERVLAPPRLSDEVRGVSIPSHPTPDTVGDPRFPGGPRSNDMRVGMGTMACGARRWGRHRHQRPRPNQECFSCSLDGVRLLPSCPSNPSNPRGSLPRGFYCAPLEILDSDQVDRVVPVAVTTSHDSWFGFVLDAHGLGERQDKGDKRRGAHRYTHRGCRGDEEDEDVAGRCSHAVGPI